MLHNKLLRAKPKTTVTQNLRANYQIYFGINQMVLQNLKTRQAYVLEWMSISLYKKKQ